MLLAGCGSAGPAELDSQTAAATGLPPGVGDCAFANLTTIDADHLAVAHARPQAPYYVVHRLRSATGFDVDIAGEIATGLGFRTNQIVWSELTRARDKDGRPLFDMAIAQLSKQTASAAVDLTKPYFTETQALIARPGTPMAKVTSSQELADSTLGVVRGSTSQAYVTNVLGLDPVAYQSTTVLKTAMRDRYITGMVVPVEEVAQILKTFTEDLVVVGQFPADKDAKTYRVALPAGDPLAACVDEVLTKLTKSGRLDGLRAQWFAEGVNRIIKVQ